MSVPEVVAELVTTPQQKDIEQLFWEFCIEKIEYYKAHGWPVGEPKTIEEIIRDYNAGRDSYYGPNLSWIKEFAKEHSLIWQLPPLKRRNNASIVFNYFYSKERDIYNKGNHINFEDGILYSYGWWKLAVKAKNCFVINADRYTYTTNCHLGLTISYSPKDTPQIPYSALNAANIPPEEIELIEKTDDTWEEKTIRDKKTGELKTIQIHHLGATLFRYDDRYFLSSLDQSARRESYFLVELPEEAKTVEEAFFILSGLSKEEYERYQAGEIKRQGEFFFIPIGDTKTLKAMYPWVKKLTIEKHVDLAEVFRPGHGGNLHIATEMVRILGGIFVRGTVRHYRRVYDRINPLRPGEHRMMRLGKIWHMVKINNAVNSWTAAGRVD